MDLWTDGEDEDTPQGQPGASSTREPSRTESLSDMDLEEGEYQEDIVDEPSLEDGEVQVDVEESRTSRHSLESIDKTPSVSQSLPSDLSLNEMCGKLK